MKLLKDHINFNDNREHDLTENNFDYHLSDSSSKHHSNENSSDLNTLLLEISNKLHKKINRIDTLVLRSNIRFGNYVITLNNAIYFCEILKCREIFIDNMI